MSLYDALDAVLPIDLSDLDPRADAWAGAGNDPDPFDSLVGGAGAKSPGVPANPFAAGAPGGVVRTAAPPAAQTPSGEPGTGGRFDPSAIARQLDTTPANQGSFFSSVATPEMTAAAQAAAELAARVADLDPGTSVSAAELMGEHDRVIANTIEKELADWTKKYQARFGGNVPDENRDAQLVEIVASHRNELVAPDEVVITYVKNLAEGLFGFESLLDNPDVSDILINDHDSLFVEEKGVLSRRNSPFRNKADLETFVNRLINRTGGTLSISEPFLDEQFEYDAPYGRLNVRVNVNLGSLTVSGAPAISLRKPVASGFDLLETWMKVREGDDDSPLSEVAANFLALAFRARASILVVGGTGSGKTSLMKALLRQVDGSERIVVVEESNELDFRAVIPNYVGLIANAAPNQRIQHLIRTAMRMRPDRIIVGELRDGSEVDGFIRAINTGHAGSISTIHASSAKDGLQAMLTLAAQNSTSKSSVEHIGRLIHPGVDLVIYLAAQPVQAPDGRMKRVRRVMEIVTVNEFSVREGVPDFAVQHVFARSIGQMGVGGRRVLSIDAPMRCFGFAGLSDTFVSRMRTFGLTEAELRGLLEGG